MEEGAQSCGEIRGCVVEGAMENGEVKKGGEFIEKSATRHGL